jgi:hypothetical protein
VQLELEAWNEIYATISAVSTDPSGMDEQSLLTHSTVRKAAEEPIPQGN